MLHMLGSPSNLRPLGNKKKYGKCCFRIFAFFESKMDSLGLGRWLKGLVEVLRFVVTELRAVGSHEEPIRDRTYDFRRI